MKVVVGQYTYVSALEMSCCHSVAKLCPALCDTMNCTIAGFPVLHYIPIVQTHIHWVNEAIQASHSLLPPSSLAFNLSQHQGLYQWVSSSPQVAQNIGASGSASVLPMNIQGWFPLGLTCLISLQSKGLSTVFSSTTVRKHQFFSAQPSLWSNSHVRLWLLDKSQVWLDGPCWQGDVSAF